MIRYQPGHPVQDGGEPGDERIAMVLDVKLKAASEKHGRASARSAVLLGEPERRSPEQQDAASAPFSLARNPESVPIASNENSGIDSLSVLGSGRGGNWPL
jgi:hypothetical protein